MGNLWLAIPIERANSCSSFLLFQITMFKFIVLSSLVMMLCIDSVFPATTVTTTSTSVKIVTSFTAVVTKSLCIKTTAGIVACRRRRGILYEKPVMPMDIGLEPAANYFLSGEPYIKTSLQENSAGHGQAMPRIFFSNFLRPTQTATVQIAAAAAATTETTETTTTTTTIESTKIGTIFDAFAETVTASCILPPMTYVCKNIKITIFQQQNWRKKMILL